jgi:hypothetical protein
MRKTFAALFTVCALAGASCVDEPSQPVADDSEGVADTGGETDEVEYAGSCSAASVLVTPLAKQCCYGIQFKNGSNKTIFILPDGRVAHRVHNDAGGGGCKASDGVSSCSGTACAFGPLGFAPPTRVSAPDPSLPYAKISTLWRSIEKDTYQIHVCNVSWYATPQTSSLPNVTGTGGRACGCACNGSGPCLDTGSDAYAAGGTCPQASQTCASTGCPVGGGGGADLFGY